MAEEEQEKDRNKPTRPREQARGQKRTYFRKFHVTEKSETQMKPGENTKTCQLESN